MNVRPSGSHVMAYLGHDIGARFDSFRVSRDGEMLGTFQSIASARQWIRHLSNLSRLRRRESVIRG